MNPFLLIIFSFLIQSSELNLTESRLGRLDLSTLNGINLIDKLNEVFPENTIERKIGRQDGPDFIYYEVKNDSQELFSIHLDPYDTSKVQEIWIKTSKVSDEFGISTGSSLNEIETQRPDIRYHVDLHYNVYGCVPSSNIKYRLTVGFKQLNDSLLVESDYSLQRWQLESNLVEYIIWSK